MKTESVIVCTWDASAPALAAETTEVLTLGRKLCVATGAELRLIVLGELSDGAQLEASRYAVARIDRLRGAGLGDLEADRYVGALARHLAAERPSIVLFAQTFDARVIAPRVAARLRAGVVMNCV